jgi:hypothetical protein
MQGRGYRFIGPIEQGAAAPPAQVDSPYTEAACGLRLQEGGSAVNLHCHALPFFDRPAAESPRCHKVRSLGSKGTRVC